MVRALLMIVIVGSFPVIPNRSVSAKPLSATFAGCASQAQIPATECNTLVDLYNSANGASWIQNTGWLLTDTPCSWYGVSCTGTHVTGLSFYWNKLTGSIPAGLGNLTQLTNLALSGNQLTGPIPTLMMTIRNIECRSQVNDRRKHVMGILRMSTHFFPLILGKRTRFLKNAIRNSHFSYVM